MLDQELLIIAVLVITFLNWVSTKLKERSDRKKGILPDQEQQEIDYSEEPEISFSNEPNNQFQESLGLKDLIDALGGNEMPKQIEPIPITPPIIEEATTYHESINSEGTPDSENLNFITEKKSNRSNEIWNKQTSSIHPIIKKLRQDGGAREAIIFSEILKKPLGLRRDY